MDASYTNNSAHPRYNNNNLLFHCITIVFLNLTIIIISIHFSVECYYVNYLILCELSPDRPQILVLNLIQDLSCVLFIIVDSITDKVDEECLHTILQRYCMQNQKFQ